MAIQRIIHPDGELMEEYALGRLAEPNLGKFEEYILGCPRCRAQLDSTTEFIAVVREAATLVASTPPRDSSFGRWLRMDWFPMAAPAFAAAVLMVVGLAGWQAFRTPLPLKAQTVTLQALRGRLPTEPARSRTALNIQLDVTGLASEGLVAQIVNTKGKILMESPVLAAGEKALLTVSAGLAAGRYWVRLKEAGETVREFALVVSE